uniref:Uncharacterized protein n=1 Tax=Physcomitrium patens TaxID=3218 RepID=A0A2K1KGF8_PHYPA|nr:hypothetical protein PHYPA_009236 [Physcomitrium patens]
MLVVFSAPVCNAHAVVAITHGAILHLIREMESRTFGIAEWDARALSLPHVTVKK